VLAGKARSLLQGRQHVSIEDIRAVALPVLRHRILTNFNAEAEGIKSDAIVAKLLEHVPAQPHEKLDPSVQTALRT
jgi:MoxR-like ATPase